MDQFQVLQSLSIMKERASRSEKRAVSELKKKSGEDIANLYDRYAAPILGIIYRIIPNKVVAEKILTLVFRKAIRNLALHNSAKESLFTWLMQIVRQESASYIRKNPEYPAEKVLKRDAKPSSRKGTIQEIAEPAIKSKPKLFRDSQLLDQLLMTMKSPLQKAKGSGIISGNMKIKVYRSVKSLRILLNTQKHSS